MRDVHIDVARLLIELVDHHDRIGGVNPVQRLPAARVHRKSRNPGRPAALARDVGDFALQHLVIRLLHLLLCPILKHRVGEIGDPVGRLASTAIGHVGIFGIGHHGRADGIGCEQEVIAGGTIRHPSAFDGEHRVLGFFFRRAVRRERATVMAAPHSRPVRALPRRNGGSSLSPAVRSRACCLAGRE